MVVIWGQGSFRSSGFLLWRWGWFRRGRWTMCGLPWRGNGRPRTSTSPRGASSHARSAARTAPYTTPRRRSGVTWISLSMRRISTPKGREFSILSMACIWCPWGSSPAWSGRPTIGSGECLSTMSRKLVPRWGTDAAMITSPLFVDLVAKRLLCSRTGEVAKTFKAFAEVLQLYGGSAEAIMDISMDLSPAFQKGAAEHLPRAQVTFDRFYRLELINEAVGAVRKGEAHNRPSLEKTRSLWLKNPGKLIAKQSKRLQDLLEEQNLRTAQAYQFRLTFQEIFTIQNRHHGAYTLMNHWDWVLRWFESQITKGILERFNSLLQSAKAKARGYRTHKNFIAIACLILGKLDLRLTT